MIVSLHPHELLVNIVISLTSSIATTGSPLAKNGELKRELNYNFEINVFEEEYKKIFGKNFHPPDGLLRNKLNKISITVECKSGIDEDNTNLIKQLKFYSENLKFREIFINQDEKNEILIVCIEDIIDLILEMIRKDKIKQNLVVWAAKKTQQDKYFVQKRFGTHLDKELDEKMKKGIIALPPVSLLLISPYHSPPRLIAEISKRLLSSFFIQRLRVDDFINRQTDSILSYRKIIRYIKFVFTLIPELGHLEDDIITFRKQPKLDLIKTKIDFINNLNKKEVQHFLKSGALTKKDMENIEQLREGQLTIDVWSKNKG